MIAQVGSSAPLSRRQLLSVPLTAALGYACQDERVVAATVERTTIATVARDDGLAPPLTLGIARVILRHGAAAWSKTPGGVRMIVVEAGVLAVATTSRRRNRFTAAELVIAGPPPDADDELLAPAGTVMTFASRGVASVRNPGTRAVVVLDVAVYPEEPRPLARAFTTEEGVSFHLLANANSPEAPLGPVIVTLERLRLGAHAAAPVDVGRGLTLAYVEAGTLAFTARMGDVFAARAAAAAPYSMPGSLQAMALGQEREVTAGGVMFLSLGSEASIVNAKDRPVDVMSVAVREAA